MHDDGRLPHLRAGDAVERAYERWTGLGRPDHGSVELLATPDGLTIDDGRPRHPESG
ncbi:hypothetical protein Ae168Ps1_5480c [Pseudonocardia sp. Ae168_Ps1]|nr:hypothetical protein Ae168Ps1_5480c [Pseudonocardia sp. Ae168_Ps1]OLL77472.1 hypothetical protein Ae150APs1_5850 [Pseudonocardia sp. Ae150A_Ps1]OLL88415.1 hypothetical protein Ae263Ps1_5470c [Pseudonocardia sp. Ae263_Ps1]OLL91562.1 hypothetical protein Ae356Ps1_1459 [Pseudonocardia sp. Ae356_Ps1]